MKKILATAAASLAFMGMAYAATVEGTVQMIDPSTRTITLDDGTTFRAPEGASIEQIAVGAKIKVTVDDTTGAVTAVDVAS
ncbi:MAG: DUF1344 domain-containing protein [Rhizobiaceae bacterium]